MVQVIPNASKSLKATSPDFKFASSVAWFGMKLRDSKYIENKEIEDILSLAKEGLDNDSEGYKAEFIRLAKSAKI